MMSPLYDANKKQKWLHGANNIIRLKEDKNINYSDKVMEHFMNQK